MPASDTSAKSGGEASNGHAAAPAEAVRQAVSQVAELREYVTYLISAYLDRVKSSIRTAAVLAAVGLVGLLAAAAIVATAAVLLLVGAAHGLGSLFGDRYWLGDLVVALVIFLTVGLGAFIGLKTVRGLAYKQLVKKYEDRQRRERVNFGRDVRNFKGADPGSTPAASEAAFLQQQAEAAHAAIGTVVSEITQKLREGANPIEWAREYPLISVGVAALAGFLGAAALVPSKEEQAMARLAALEHTLHPKPAEDSKRDRPADNGDQGSAPKGISGMIIREIIKSLGPMATSLITGLVGMKAGEKAGEAEASGDGNADSGASGFAGAGGRA